MKIVLLLSLLLLFSCSQREQNIPEDEEKTIDLNLPTTLSPETMTSSETSYESLTNNDTFQILTTSENIYEEYLTTLSTVEIDAELSKIDEIARRNVYTQLALGIQLAEVYVQRQFPDPSQAAEEEILRFRNLEVLKLRKEYGDRVGVDIGVLNKIFLLGQENKWEIDVLPVLSPLDSLNE